ncbi:hypothetical protein QQX98_004070 [Neonectria punicea]|uniref:C2H2-type domain-containing protein n=1 Tax=Neonectria punicea TaxID=979145 RepID=A0ABR1HB23_9HYPO
MDAKRRKLAGDIPESQRLSTSRGNLTIKARIIDYCRRLALRPVPHGARPGHCLATDHGLSTCPPRPIHDDRGPSPKRSKTFNERFRDLAITRPVDRNRDHGANRQGPYSEPRPNNSSLFPGAWQKHSKDKRDRELRKKSPGEEPPDGHGAKKAKADAQEKRRLACPFYKYDRRHYWSCRRKKLRSVADVRQHLERVHLQEEHCPICKITFTDFPDNTLRQQWDAHIRRLDCVLSPREVPGITKDQWNQIKTRRIRRGSKAENWYELWEILFPDRARPDSPYLHPSELDETIRDQTLTNPYEFIPAEPDHSPRPNHHQVPLPVPHTAPMDDPPSHTATNTTELTTVLEMMPDLGVIPDLDVMTGPSFITSLPPFNPDNLADDDSYDRFLCNPVPHLPLQDYTEDNLTQGCPPHQDQDHEYPLQEQPPPSPPPPTHEHPSQEYPPQTISSEYHSPDYSTREYPSQQDFSQGLDIEGFAPLSYYAYYLSLHHQQEHDGLDKQE